MGGIKVDEAETDTIVVGGGAAGMLAALAASRAGQRVCLLEQNDKLGRKLFITGKGRCNVTNNCDMETLFENICVNPKFLYSAFYCFTNRDMMELLEEAGCRLKTERGGRVFPVSDRSSDVIGALVRLLNRNGVEIRLKTKAAGLATETEEEAVIKGVRLENGEILRARRVILATGGVSYEPTGATGDGLRYARETGHRITELRPSLVPLEVRESWCAEVMGLALKNVAVTLKRGKKEIYHGFGEMLFTHFGVSGPLILSASSFYAKQEPEECRLYIDLKPALDREELDKRLLKDFEEHSNKKFANALGGLFPVRLIPVMIRHSGIDPDKKVREITREERRFFAEQIKALPLTVTGTRSFREAIITRGGVSVKDVNPSTMESKKVKGLYFAGEILDLDALTGGFNLQIAWSTGYLAGSRPL